MIPLQEKADSFAIQLSVYRGAVRQLFGADARTFIYFSELSEFVEVEEKVDELKELM